MDVRENNVIFYFKTGCPWNLSHFYPAFITRADVWTDKVLLVQYFAEQILLELFISKMCIKLNISMVGYAWYSVNLKLQIKGVLSIFYFWAFSGSSSWPEIIYWNLILKSIQYFLLEMCNYPCVRVCLQNGAVCILSPQFFNRSNLRCRPKQHSS